MALKKKLDSIEKTETIYIIAGIFLLALTAVGLQYQGSNPDMTDDQITISLELDKPDSDVRQEVDLGANSTAFDALNKSFEVNYAEYDFGYFVTSINGISQNQTHSWLYLVNDEPATKAVNKYYLSEGDNVTFIYTSENLFE